MIGVLLATGAALALEPPRLEVVAGWSGNADHGFGFATVQPALVRSIDASLLLRTTASQLYYTYVDEEGRLARVDAPGLAAGPAFVYTPGDLSLGLAIGVGVRHSTVRAVEAPEAAPTVTLKPDATLSGDLYWRPGQRGQLFSSFSFSAAEPYLWGRAGASHPVFPMFRENPPLALWLGLEGTGSGAFRANETGAWLAGRAFSVGPFAELPIRDLRTVLTARVGLQLTDATGELERRGVTAGVGAYWSY